MHFKLNFVLKIIKDPGQINALYWKRRCENKLRLSVNTKIFLSKYHHAEHFYLVLTIQKNMRSSDLENSNYVGTGLLCEILTFE